MLIATALTLTAALAFAAGLATSIWIAARRIAHLALTGKTTPAGYGYTITRTRKQLGGRPAAPDAQHHGLSTSLPLLTPNAR